MTYVLLSLFALSGYPVGWSIMKLAVSEEEISTSGESRNWKAVVSWLIFLILSLTTALVLALVVAYVAHPTSGEVAIFGMGAMGLFCTPMAGYRWQQRKQRNKR